MKRFESLCNEYRENKRLIEELQAMNDSIKSEILAIMGNDETHVEGAAKATNKTIVSSRFDSSGFKKVYPDLFNEYSRETSYKRFCVL
jgi:predicted phage-related endonuclease